jgi:hypothetical protein
MARRRKADAPPGYFDVYKEMRWYRAYYNGDATPLRETEIVVNIDKDAPEHPLNKYNVQRSIPVVAYDETGKQVAEYPSISEAARKNKISKACICFVLNGSQKKTAGLFWKYKTENNGN